MIKEKFFCRYCWEIYEGRPTIVYEKTKSKAIFTVNGRFSVFLGCEKCFKEKFKNQKLRKISKKEYLIDAKISP